MYFPVAFLWHILAIVVYFLTEEPAVIKAAFVAFSFTFQLVFIAQNKLV